MKKKILVVDDDRVILKFVTKLLEREGHEVVTAEDGFAALNLLSTFTPDIMFFDLIMPKIDGGKLIQIVRSMPRLTDCYLVIISAAVAEIDFDFEETGADSYIAKGPFSSMAENIKAAIETIQRFILEVTGEEATQQEIAKALTRYFVLNEIKEYIELYRENPEM